MSARVRLGVSRSAGVRAPVHVVRAFIVRALTVRVFIVRTFIVGVLAIGVLVGARWPVTGGGVTIYLDPSEEGRAIGDALRSRLLSTSLVHPDGRRARVRTESDASPLVRRWKETVVATVNGLGDAHRRPPLSVTQRPDPGTEDASPRTPLSRKSSTAASTNEPPPVSEAAKRNCTSGPSSTKSFTI